MWGVGDTVLVSQDLGLKAQMITSAFHVSLVHLETRRFSVMREISNVGFLRIR